MEFHDVKCVSSRQLANMSAKQCKDSSKMSGTISYLNIVCSKASEITDGVIKRCGKDFDYLYENFIKAFKKDLCRWVSYLVIL